MPDPAKTAWRRLYVFVAVALAVFLAAMSSVGLMCHGFAMSSAAGSTVTTNQRSTNEPIEVPLELKAALAKARRQSQQAYEAVQKAVAMPVDIIFNAAHKGCSR